MTEHIITALFIVVTLTAFTAGFVIGRNNNNSKPRISEPTATVEAASEHITSQQLKVQEEQALKQAAAFKQMLNYNPNIAYGVGSAEEGADT